MPTGSDGWAAAVGTSVRNLPWERVAAPLRGAAAALMGVRVWIVLGVLVLVQWAIVGVIAAITSHNGLVYYSGGDDTWYYTSAWVLGHGHVPQAYVGYGYPFLLAPLALASGSSLIAGLPLVVAFNVLVLVPVALLCVYGIAKAIGGRGFAYVSSLLWTVFPVAAIPYFYQRYHTRYVDQLLPSASGLVAMADFPSLVLLLVAAYFVVRTAAERRPTDALLAGAAAGFAVAVKPANLIFLPAPFAAFAFARRWRELLRFCVALVPALLGLALWKYRGLGYLPAFQSPPSALASGPTASLPVGDVNWDKYLRIDWSRLRDNYFGIREYTWSLRMITWILVAGVIALARRGGFFAVLIGGWLASFIALKATVPGVNVTDGSFFRYMMPAFPAFFFCLVSLPLLVPIAGRRLAAAGRAAGFAPIGKRGCAGALAVAGILCFVPLLALVAFRPLTAASATRVPTLDQYVPANTFPLSATRRGHRGVVLEWPSQDARGSRVNYVVFREQQDGLVCVPRVHAAADCTFVTDRLNSRLSPVAQTRRTSFVDAAPDGRWVYRVAAMVSPHGPKEPGNFLALSRAATAVVSR